MPTKEELGRRIKAVRVERGMTLKEVELRSGVSMTHTSQIERGMTSPTIGALEKLARALDKTLPFFVEERVVSEVSLIRKEDRTQVRQDRNGFQVESLSGGVTGGSLQFFHVSLSEGAKETRRREHDGEECGVVLKGSIEVGIGEQKHTLRAGDSIHFKGSAPHYIRNAGRTRAEAIWVSDKNPFL